MKPLLANHTMSWFNRLFRKSQPPPEARLTEGVNLKWDEYFWAGDIVLPAWAGFQERLGAYSDRSASEPSKGQAHLSVSSPTDSNQTISPPSKEQELAFCFLRDNGELLRDKVIKAIFDEYPKMRETFADFLGKDFETVMPELRAPSDLKRLIGLSTIHISDVTKDGLAYLGFEFGCDWEEEHGLGVMTHKDRIIEVGDAETSFNASINER